METQANQALKKTLLVINCIILAIGNCGSPLLIRLYFIEGGKRIWLASWLQTAAWPIIFIPLLISYFHRRKKTDQGPEKPNLILMKYPVFIATAFIGLLTGLDDYFYGYAGSRLPVSTSSILIASQLAFTAFFAFLLVKQKFTAYSVNAVVLLLVGSAILGMRASSDRPEGVSNKMYIIGFLMMLAAAALYGLILPMVELMYMKAKQAITYTLVLEIQLVMCFFATVFCTVGMIINNDFQAISREAREYELGETKYYIVLVFCAIVSQFFFLGSIGVVFCASSLLSGIVISVLLPVTEILAVIFFNERFQAEKGVALVLSLWGFVSYFYGEIRKTKLEEQKNIDQIVVTEIPSQTAEVTPFDIP